MHHLLRVAALAVMLTFVMAAAAQAATYNVTTTNDDNPADATDCPANGSASGCSLREAVAAANDSTADDTINVPSGTYTLTNDDDDNDGDADLDVMAGNDSDESAGDLTVTGAGARSTVIRSMGFDGADQITSRLIDVEGGESYDPGSGCVDFPGPDVTIQNVMLTRGADDDGAGLYVDDGDTTNCGAGDDTPATDAEVTLRQTAVVANSAGQNDGGGIYNGGELTVVDSLIHGNATQQSGYTGGGIYNADTVSLTNVTVSGNEAGAGGGIRSRTDEIEYEDDGGDEIRAIVNATNVTLVFNQANDYDSGGGGGYLGGGPFNDEDARLLVRNSIIAHNDSITGGNNCFWPSSVESLGNNLSDDDSCNLTAAGDQTNTDPGLGSRGDNGGDTDTYPLSTVSPAVDAGSFDGAPAADQRGVARPQGNGIDIGAYELVPPPPEAPPAPPAEPEPSVITNTVLVPTTFPRVRPRSLSLTVRKTRPTRRSLRLRSSGRVRLPAGLTAAEACTFGVVAVQVKANGKTVSTRIASLRRNCRYSSRVTFNAMRRIRNRTLTVRARFFGNDRLRTRYSRKRSAGRA